MLSDKLENGHGALKMQNESKFINEKGSDGIRILLVVRMKDDSQTDRETGVCSLKECLETRIQSM